MKRRLFTLLLASLAVPLLVARQPPGQIHPRPAEGRQPEFKPPTIREYKPKSQLIVPEHQVPRARFPVIDIHSHQPTPISPAEYDRVMKGMQANNLQILVNLSGSSADRLRQGIDALRASKYKDRMVLFANVSFRDVGPGFGAQAARQLEQDIKAGAMGLKIFKDLGMFVRKANGSRLPVDDAELDPIWETCARLNVPVLIHVGEPAAFFEPLDYRNERWLELSLYQDRRHQEGVRFEQLMTERNNMIRKHPTTKFILAHFGWHANDLARAGKLLDQNPNVYYDVAAVLYDFGRQPRAAHEFFIKYQDRIMFGTDTTPRREAFRIYYRFLETEDEYFDYAPSRVPPQGRWRIYGLGLPEQILRKVYYQNAERILRSKLVEA